VSSNENNKRKV